MGRLRRSSTKKVGDGNASVCAVCAVTIRCLTLRCGGRTPFVDLCVQNNQKAPRLYRNICDGANAALPIGPTRCKARAQAYLHLLDVSFLSVHTQVALFQLLSACCSRSFKEMAVYCHEVFCLAFSEKCTVCEERQIVSPFTLLHHFTMLHQCTFIFSRDHQLILPRVEVFCARDLSLSTPIDSLLTSRLFLFVPPHGSLFVITAPAECRASRREAAD